MNVLRKILYYALIIGLCLTGPGMLWGWKKWVEPNWGTKQVVVVIQPLERGARITEKDVQLIQLPQEAVVQGALTSMKGLIGVETSRSLRVREQVTPEAIDTAGLVPGPGQWNMPLPTEWIFGRPPGSLLRGDQVTLLPIPKEVQGEYTEADLEALRQSYEVDERLSGLTVSFSKGSNNQEIIASQYDRKNPSGSVATVELIVNEEQIKLIRQYGLRGDRFLLIYK